MRVRVGRSYFFGGSSRSPIMALLCILGVFAADYKIPTEKYLCSWSGGWKPFRSSVARSPRSLPRIAFGAGYRFMNNSQKSWKRTSYRKYWLSIPGLSSSNSRILMRQSYVFRLTGNVEHDLLKSPSKSKWVCLMSFRVQGVCYSLGSSIVLNLKTTPL